MSARRVANFNPMKVLKSACEINEAAEEFHGDNNIKDLLCNLLRHTLNILPTPPPFWEFANAGGTLCWLEVEGWRATYYMVRVLVGISVLLSSEPGIRLVGSS